VVTSISSVLSSSCRREERGKGERAREEDRSKASHLRLEATYDTDSNQKLHDVVLRSSNDHDIAATKDRIDEAISETNRFKFLENYSSDE
jgi:hypothetical protein